MKIKILSILLVCFFSNIQATEQLPVANLEEGKGFYLKSIDGIVVKAALIKGTTYLLISKNNKDLFAVNLASPNEVQTMGKTIERQSCITFDENGDGIPEKRLVLKQKGNLDRAELFYQGNFIKANRQKGKWITKKGELFYKKGLWQLAQP